MDLTGFFVGVVASLTAATIIYLIKNQLVPRLTELGRRAPDISGEWTLYSTSDQRKGPFDITQKGNQLSIRHRDEEDNQTFIYQGTVNDSGVAVTSWHNERDQREIGALLIFKPIREPALRIKSVFLNSNGDYVANDYIAKKSGA